MLRKGIILAIGVLVVSGITIFSIASAEESLIPSWIKNTASFWVSGDVSDKEFISAIEWMLENKVLQVSTTDDGEWKGEADDLYRENQALKGDIKVLEKDVSTLTQDNRWLDDAKDKHYDMYVLEFNQANEYYSNYQDLAYEYNRLYDSYLTLYNLNTGYGSGGSSYYEEKFGSTPEALTPPPPKKTETPPPKQAESPPPITQDCSGTARCFTGQVTQVVDGDTIKVDGQSIRFALASTPELDEPGGALAKDYIEETCPVGSTALVDEDDGQTEGSYGRIVGVIYCNGINLNEFVLDEGLGYLSSGFCYKSEFKTHSWAIRHGC